MRAIQVIPIFKFFETSEEYETYINCMPYELTSVLSSLYDIRCRIPELFSWCTLT